MRSGIAIFLPSLAGGGAERVMVTLTNGMAARGYRVDLVLAQATGPYLGEVDAGVRVVDLEAGRVIKSLIPLVRYLRRERPVAMLSAMNHANVVAILARRLARVGTRLVVSERIHISTEVARVRGLSARLVYWLMPRLYPEADGRVAVSQGAARDLEAFASLAEGQVQTIYNPFDLERIARLAREPVAHPWLGPEHPPVILAVGRLTEQKDFPTLIRAFAMLRDKQPARLLILGEGELRSELEALARSLGLGEDVIQMPGFAANPYAYMARAAVFVLSSRWEGLPGVLIEAMACGAPVVSTDCPSGPWEILEAGRWGRLVPVGDVEALAQAIEEVLAVPRTNLPRVQVRAATFDEAHAIDAYLRALGLPPRPVEGTVE